MIKKQLLEVEVCENCGAIFSDTVENDKKYHCKFCKVDFCECENNTLSFDGFVESIQEILYSNINICFPSGDLNDYKSNLFNGENILKEHEYICLDCFKKISQNISKKKKEINKLNDKIKKDILDLINKHNKNLNTIINKAIEDCTPKINKKKSK